MIGRCAGGAGVDLEFVRTVDQIGFLQNVAMDTTSGLCGETFVGQQCAGGGVFQTDRDALHRRVGVERQPGGAGLGDGDLADQKVDSARHPEADHAARPDAMADEAARHRGRERIYFCIGNPAVAGDHADVVGMGGGGRRENFGQNFVADQIGARGAAQDGRNRRCRQDRSRGNFGFGPGTLRQHIVVLVHCNRRPVLVAIGVPATTARVDHGYLGSFVRLPARQGLSSAVSAGLAETWRET